MNIYTEVLKRNIPHSNHYSDLYLPDSPEVQELLKEFPEIRGVSRFTNQVEGGIWIELPFQYLPYWEEKAKSRKT